MDKRAVLAMGAEVPETRKGKDWGREAEGPTQSFRALGPHSQPEVRARLAAPTGPPGQPQLDP